MMRKNLLTAMLTMCCAVAWAGTNGEMEYRARIGYNIGGTAPVGLPSSIRTLHSYTLRPNFSLGMDAHRSLSAGWGVTLGIRLEEKGMKTDAAVKGYHMKMERGGEQLEGVFTGSVVTENDMLLVTVPLLATYNIGEKVRLKVGPYASYALAKSFKGWAYDGYLRRQEEGHPQGDPTGQKVILGHNEGERGDYDFADDMRSWQVGVELEADWLFCKRWGVSVGINWGLNSIFKRGFSVIEQTMYPIYGNIGIFYQL